MPLTLNSKERAMDKKAVVVTGASSGIGAASADLLQSESFHVIGCALPDTDGEAMMAKASETFTPLYMDVTDSTSISSAVDKITRHLGEGGLAGLVNNAGVASGGPLELQRTEDLRRVMEINVIGSVAVTNAFLPQLRKARGRIVFTGSMLGRCAAPMSSIYSPSKFALEAVADIFRMELRPWGINVSLIQPDVVQTPILNKSMTQTDGLFSDPSSEQSVLYEEVYRQARGRLESAAKTAITPDKVAKRVVHALTAKKPRTRYPVGWKAKVLVWLRFLPDRWRDSILLSSMK
jgi:NAD(P)-dependent dehydrogenase (short-subunit alcohol dehydrogenase family)